ncbi:MAG: hypothetical protein D6693_10500 [Planctomycetota bacterium]|nr:MAG: hypothetical protein D6693_10500 [Planctomycetota bacterium]
MNRFQTLSVIAALAGAGAARAASVDVSYTRITSNSGQNVESQFITTVTEVAGDPTVIDFIFRNNVGIASSISEVYFDNGATSSLFSGGAIAQQVGASFVFGSASPPDLPGGNSLADPFDVTPGFLADAQGNPSVGLNTASDLLRIRMTLLAGVTFGDVESALGTGALRLGMHVRAIGDDGESDSFVNGPPPIVPLPGGGAMGLAALTILASRRRR